MSIRLKIFLISFVISLPFWLGVNALAESLEEILFLQELVKSPQVFSAQVSNLVKGERSDSQDQNNIELLVDDSENDTKAIISIEIDSRGNEKILFEKNSQEQLAIASLTKLMTALVVFDLDETYDFSQVIEMSKEAIEQEGASKYGELREGESFSIETLLHVMLIESSNDAAYAIGQVIGEQGFIELMNYYGKTIGLENTHFNNLTGLEPDDPQKPRNLSTAQDIIKLAKHISGNYPQIFEITTKTSYEVFDSDGDLHHFIPENTNELLIEIPGIIGGKTGWSPEAGGCLLVIIENPERNSHIINVILGADDRFEEMRKLIELTNY